jgi:hypothetical protein
MSPMNPRLLRPTASGRFLLDQYGSAAAAYSLRRLRGGYTGAAVRVRRANDNAEADFRPEEISNGTLTAWTGANNGLVVTWYDQSGSGRNATQATAGNQPSIVSSGSLNLLNGKPAIQWSSGRILTGTITTGAAISCAAVFSAQANSAYQKLCVLGGDGATSGTTINAYMGATANDWVADDFAFLGNGSNSGRAPRIISSGSAITSSTTTQSILTTFLSSSTARAFVNRTEMSYRVQLTGAVPAITNGTTNIGNGPFAHFLNGSLQELIVWSADLIVDRAGIEQNIDAYY